MWGVNKNDDCLSRRMRAIERHYSCYISGVTKVSCCVTEHRYTATFKKRSIAVSAWSRTITGALDSLELEIKKTKGEKMTMSKDRVKFRIPNCRFWSGSSGCYYRDLLKKAFGITQIELPPYNDGYTGEGDLVVICRPSQFARFIVMRYDLSLKTGIQNQTVELAPELIIGPTDTFPLEVWDRPATHTDL